MRRRARFLISGRVQGVCYRMDACDEAGRLGLSGWVRNLADGNVEIVAEGEESALREFFGWCRQGPPGAHVTDISEEYSEARGDFDFFNITY